MLLLAEMLLAAQPPFPGKNDAEAKSCNRKLERWIWMTGQVVQRVRKGNYVFNDIAWSTVFGAWIHNTRWLPARSVARC